LIIEEPFTHATEYDALGRVKKETYPSGYYTHNKYDTNGYLYEITDNANRSIWKAVEGNAMGQLTKKQPESICPR